MKSVLIGSVGTSREMLKAMIDIKFPVCHVFSVDEKYSDSISGYQPIHRIAGDFGIPFTKIYKINDPENIEIIKSIEPDYIFVIGFSQLIKKEIIDLAKIGVIGFHPTPLPKMRGRAANVWQILLGVRETKCSLFFIDEGIDSGDILGQQEYVIEDTDYAIDVERKINKASRELFKRVLYEILNGSCKPAKQNDDEATYLLKRSPEDGHIDWNDSIIKIHRLVRAVSKPYPGAFGMYDGEHPIIIWRADICENKKYIGVNGQIAKMNGEEMLIVCKDGLLKVTEYENVDDIKLFVGHKLR